MKKTILLLSAVSINAVIYGQYYVNPNTGSDSSGNGSAASPYKTIAKGITAANNNSVSAVYVVAGTYDLPSVNITTNCTNLITVSPEPGKKVVLQNGNARFIRFYSGANNVKFSGFEIDGKSNANDHWTILSQYVWNPDIFTTAGGGIAFSVEDSTNITIDNNIIHDFYQKAVNIQDARYLTVSGNIIYNIALTSLSGGHAIMRQQGYGSFANADDTTKYRWDINGNLIFNVAQRIYSWVPSKGYMNMTLDEGKPINIDETPSHDLNMKARITQNVIAYNYIDAIRLKPTVNLEVSNNSVYSENADGITETLGGTSFTDPFKGLKVTNNLVTVPSANIAYDFSDISISTGVTTSNNFYTAGSKNPTTIANATTSQYIDASNGNFQLTTGSQTYGASSATISSLQSKASAAGVVVQKATFVTNHLKNTQTLLDAVPGLEDGVTGNESVFTDAGAYDKSDQEWTAGRKSLYFGVNSTWQSANGVSAASLNHNSHSTLAVYNGKYEIIVPVEYSTWLDAKRATYGTTKRIRYGESVIAQDKVFPTNSVYIEEINSTTDYQLTTALNNKVTLDGDLVVKFNYTPVGNESYDILVAKTIATNNVSSLFDSVSLIGYSGTYTLTKGLTAKAGYETLRLTLTNTTLSTNDVAKRQVSIYPNPSGKDGFYITNPTTNKDFSVKVYNTLGQEMAFESSLSENANIHCKPNTSISAGIYLVKVRIGNQEKQMKLIVK